MLQVIAIGCRRRRQSAMEATAPLAHTMDTLPLPKPSASLTASCSGSAPHAYHTNAVRPATTAAALRSARKLELHVHQLRVAIARGAEADAPAEAEHGAIALAHDA